MSSLGASTPHRRSRVGVNLTWLVPGVVGGSEESTVAALDAAAMPADEAGIEIVLFANSSLDSAHPGLTRRFETVVAPYDGTGKARRVVGESTWLRHAARDARLDLMHHAGGVVPPVGGVPTTVTIHDLQPLDLPGNFDLAKRWYLRAMLGSSARRAKQVAVPSDFTAARVVARLGVPTDHVTVVPWTAPAAPEESTAAATPVDPDVVRADMGVGERYFLFPAITYAHKGHLVLLEAFEAVLQKDPTLELVLCGGDGPLEAEVVERIAQLAEPDAVHRFGRVPDRVLDALYRRAVAVVFPSAYEGFGLPALEAMVRDCAVIVADAGALPEVVAAEAPKVGVSDIGGWADEMYAIATDDTRRADLVRAGRRAAAAFSPDRTATALLGVWESALR